MRTLIFDIEVAPTKVYVWGQKMWEENVIKVLEPPYMLCFAYKWLGEKTKTVALPDFKLYNKDKKNDYEVIKALRELLSEADLVIGQNSDKFDIKWFNTRCLLHKLPPPEPYKTLDTLKINKKYFKFISNKLDVVASLLGHGRKMEHEGFPLWEKCMAGCPKAWARMKKYNKRDVDLTAEVYQDILPWNQQVQPVYDKPKCPKCPGYLWKRGFETKRDGKYQRLTCRDCGATICGAKVITKP
jgi:DNA polymerase elongation subunit (family B)